MTARGDACECGAPPPEFISVVNATRHLANCPIHLTARIAELEAELFSGIGGNLYHELRDRAEAAEAQNSNYRKVIVERDTTISKAVELLRNRYGDYQLWG